MKKLTQALLLSLVIAAPVAISAPQVQANPAKSQQQTVKADSEQQLAVSTPDTKAGTMRRCYVNRMGRRVCRMMRK